MDRYRVGFVMDQVAGHVTNYLNIRRVTECDPEIDPVWCEVSYRRDGNAFERWSDRWLPFVPRYVTGNLRAGYEIRAGLRGDYEVVFTNAKVAVLFFRQIARTPTMIDFDATPVQLDQMETYTAHADPEPVARLKKWLCRQQFDAAVLLQAWSRWARQSAIDDYGQPPEKVIVNPPGVDLSFWRPPAETPAPDGPRRVLFVGGDFHRKGGDLLRDWYRTQRPDEVELHVVTREDVEPGPGVFVYHDMQPNTSRLLDLYHRADLFVLPSRGECFGIATVEAMAAGLPVIASDVGGTADIVDSGANGFIVASEDRRGLADAITGVLEHPERRRAMGARSRQLATERFDVRRNAALALDHLKVIARSRRAAR